MGFLSSIKKADGDLGLGDSQTERDVSRTMHSESESALNDSFSCAFFLPIKKSKADFLGTVSTLGVAAFWGGVPVTSVTVSLALMFAGASIISRTESESSLFFKKQIGEIIFRGINYF